MSEAGTLSHAADDPALDGIERLPGGRARAARDATSCEAQNPDGGFSGREGGSDLYYTGFALRSLAVLQALNPDVCERSGAASSATKMTGSASVVDFFSLVVSCYLVPLGGGPDVLADAPADWRDRVAATLERSARPTAATARRPARRTAAPTPASSSRSASQLLDRPIPRPGPAGRVRASRGAGRTADTSRSPR